MKNLSALKNLKDIKVIEKGYIYVILRIIDGHAEKMTRGTLKSAVERNLNKDTIVILDSLNYIKGFRYELFCIAKSVATPIVIVLFLKKKSFDIDKKN